MRNNNVQISKQLYEDIIRFFFNDETDKKESIKKALIEKTDKLVKHEQYTKRRSKGDC